MKSISRKGLVKGIGVLVVLTFILTFTAFSTQVHAGFWDWLFPQDTNYECIGKTINGGLDLSGYDNFYFEDCRVNGHTSIQGNENSDSQFINSRFNGGLDIKCPTMTSIFENTEVNGGLNACYDIPEEHENGWIVQGVDCNTGEPRTEWKDLTTTEICLKVTNTYHRDREFSAGIDFNGEAPREIKFGVFKDDATIQVETPISGPKTSYVPRNATFDCPSPYYIVDGTTCGYDYTGTVGYEYTDQIRYGVDYFNENEWNEVDTGRYELEPILIDKINQEGSTKIIYIKAVRDAETEDYWKFDLFGKEDGTIMYATQDPWWNGAWLMRKKITLTNPDAFDHINETIRLEFTHNGYADTNCSDIRVTKGETTEISRTTLQTLVDWDNNNMGGHNLWKYMNDEYNYDSQNCTVFFWADVPASSTSEYYVYYNNLGVGEPTQTEFPFKIYDDFDSESTGTNPSRWDVTESGTEIVDVSNTQSYSSPNSVYIYDATNTALTSISNHFYNSTNLTTTYEYRAVAYTGQYNSIFEHLNSKTGACIYDHSGTWTLNTWYRRRYWNNLTCTAGCNALSSASACTLSGCSGFNTAPDWTGMDGTFIAEYGHVSGPRDESYQDSIRITNGIQYFNDATYVISGAEGVNGLYIYDNTTNHADLDYIWGDFFSTNITVTNFTEQAQLTAVYIELDGSNHTAILIEPATGGQQGGIYNWNTTLYLSPGIYQIKQYANESFSNTNSTNSSSFFNITFDYFNNLTANLSILPVNGTFGYGPTTTATCDSDTASATKTLFRNGVQVSNPDVQTLNHGDYNYTCETNLTGHNNATDYQQLTVLSGVNITEYDVCGSYKDTFHLYVVNETGDSYYRNIQPTGLVVNSSLLPKGNSMFQMSNDTTSQVNATFNYTVPSSDFYREEQATGYNLYLMDIDVKDEQTGADIYFDISIYNSTYSINASDVTNFTGTWDTLPHGDITIKLSNTTDDYVTRYYYTTITQCSDYNETLYMLSADDGVYIAILVYDLSSGSALSEVHLTAERLFGTTWETVQEALTDSSGGATMWLNPDTQYRITASKSGYEDEVGLITPSTISQYYTIYMGTSTAIDREFVWDNINSNWQPSIATLHPLNETETGFQYSVNWTVVSLDDKLTNYGLEIYWNDTLLFTDTGANSGGGTIYGQFNVTGNITEDNLINCRAYFVRTSPTATEYVYRNYYIRNYTSGDYSILNLINYADMTSTQWQFIVLMIGIVCGILAGYYSASPWFGGMITLGVYGLFTAITYADSSNIVYFNPLILGVLILGYIGIYGVRK